MKLLITLGFLLSAASASATPVYVNQADFNEIIDFTLIANFCSFASPELGMQSKRELAERMVMLSPEGDKIFKVKDGFLDQDSKDNKAKVEADLPKAKALCLMMVGPMKQFNAKYGVE